MSKSRQRASGLDMMMHVEAGWTHEKKCKQDFDRSFDQPWPEFTVARIGRRCDGPAAKVLKFGHQPRIPIARDE